MKTNVSVVELQGYNKQQATLFAFLIVLESSCFIYSPGISLILNNRPIYPGLELPPREDHEATQGSEPCSRTLQHATTLWIDNNFVSSGSRRPTVCTTAAWTKSKT